MDYLIHLPALIMTFTSSGSITAGNAVGINPSNGTVYAFSGAVSANNQLDFIGIATKTVADARKLPVIVWGPVKNIVAAVSINAGQYLTPSGSGRFAPLALTSTPNDTAYVFVTGDGTKISGSLAAGRAITSGAASGAFNALIKGF